MDDPCTFNQQDPLGRVAGESLRANTAFRDYALMGPGRSLRKLVERYKETRSRYRDGTGTERPPSAQLSRLAKWSVDYCWQDRIAVYERLLDLEEEELWKQRRKTLRKSEWEMQDRLLDLANQIIDAAPDFISEKEIMSEDGSTIIYKKLDGWLAVKAAETGSDLGRRSTGMEKEKTKVEHSGLPETAAADYAKIDDEQLERIIANLIAAAAERGAGNGPGRESTPPEPEPDAPADADGETIGTA